MNYERFVNNYHRWTHAPRSMNEAYKTPEYCSPITSFPRSMSKGARELLEITAWFFLTGLFVAFWTGLFTWLFT